MKSITYPVTGLHCGSCVAKLSKALAPFATSVSVSLAPMQVVLDEPRADFAQLQAATAQAGAYALLPAALPIETRPQPTSQPSWLATYFPLLLILGFVLGGSVLVQLGTGPVTTGETMRYFMAGFFLVFSFFKLLDVRAFADAYAGYDLLAARWHGWGLIYPFVELGLGIAYLVNFNPVATLWATIIVMGFSAIGVIRAVASKTQIQCACLGAVFKLPMSTVTIVEDLGMVAMAVVMLAMGS